MAGSIFDFGDYRLDTERYELTRSGRSISLERKPMELLILLAASEGKLVSRAEIAERLWDQEVFVDTEHGINTAIRKIRQVLRDDPERPRFVMTVTGKGYRFIATPVEAAVTGSGPAHVTKVDAAPVVDLPIVGLSGPNSAEDTAEPSSRSLEATTKMRLRKMSLGGLAVVLLILAVWLGEHAWQHRKPGRPAAVKISSVAVIPLDNLSGDPGQEYLADGMTDELITQLAKNSTLRVTSRTSVMQYKGAHRPLPEIAAALGVDGILEGSIARSGDKLHLTIQLIQASSDTHVWAESYDRDANDSVLLPRDAAITIAKTLNSSVPQPTPRYVSPAAHDAYLRGQALFFSNRDTDSGAYFQKAIELQPDYSLGWSGLSKYYCDTADHGQLTAKEAIGRCKAAALKAVELDDSSAEAHVALGAAYWFDWSWQQSLKETARAIELGPGDSETYQARAMLLVSLNRNREAIETEKKSLEVDPFARAYGLAMIFRVARRFDDAIADAKQRLEYLPNDDGLYGELAAAYEAKGMYKEEEAAAMKASALNGSLADAQRLHRVYLQGGHMALLQQKLRDAEQAALKHNVPPYDLAELHAKLGHREEALNFLEAAYRERSPGILWIQGYPEFDFLHKEERYRAIIRGMGLPPAY